jgi:hypothetical protein
MRIQKYLLIQLGLFAVILGSVSFGFGEVKKQEIMTLHGTIEQVAPDFRFLVVYESKIVLLPQTKIIDESGSVAKVIDLRVKRYVKIEALRRSDGFLAQTIVLLPLKKRIPIIAGH